MPLDEEVGIVSWKEASLATFAVLEGTEAAVLVTGADALIKLSEEEEADEDEEEEEDVGCGVNSRASDLGNPAETEPVIAFCCRD